MECGGRVVPQVQPHHSGAVLAGNLLVSPDPQKFGLKGSSPVQGAGSLMDHITAVYRNPTLKHLKHFRRFTAQQSYSVTRHYVELGNG